MLLKYLVGFSRRTRSFTAQEILNFLYDVFSPIPNDTFRKSHASSIINLQGRASSSRSAYSPENIHCNLQQPKHLGKIQRKIFTLNGTTELTPRTYTHRCNREVRSQAYIFREAIRISAPVNPKRRGRVRRVEIRAKGREEASVRESGKGSEEKKSVYSWGGGRREGRKIDLHSIMLQWRRRHHRR